MDHRIVHYDEANIAYNYMLKQTLLFLEKFEVNKVICYNFNDIIELYNIKLYILENLNTNRLADEDKKYFTKEVEKSISKIIGIFFSSITNENIGELSYGINYRYRKDYWCLFEKYKIFKRVTDIKFVELIEITKCPLQYILEQKEIVNYYDKALTEYLVEHPHFLSLIIERYFKAGCLKIHLPISLDQTKKDEILLKFINSEKSNIHLLDIITNLPVHKDFMVNDEIRAKAKEKYNERVSNFFNETKNFSYRIDIIVKFNEKQIEEFIHTEENDKLELSVSSKWIENNLDYPTLLNNLIYIFKFVDTQFRITNLSKSVHSTIFERIANENRLINQYPINSVFEIGNNYSIICIYSYAQYLEEKHGVRLEEVFQWFYDDYILHEFGIDNFVVNMPSSGSSYLEKCRTLCSELEGVVKQYNTLVEYKYVNHDVIEISSKPMAFQNIESFISKKYFYANNENVDIKNIMYLLFSDQSMLHYLEKRQTIEKYINFYEMLNNEEVEMSEYEEYQKIDINYLVSKGVIEVSNGILRFADPCETVILNDLYANEFAVTNFFCRMNSFASALEKLQLKNWIKFEEGFLSRQESAYFNYYLNKSECSNGFDLRNKYLHGTQKKRGNDSDLHKINYYTILMLFSLLTIKINNEICQADTLQT